MNPQLPDAPNTPIPELHAFPQLSPPTFIPLEVLRPLLRRCGRGIKVFSCCRIFPPEQVSIGDCSQIDEGVRIYAGLGVEIGRFSHLAFNSSISGGGECAIGDFVGIGAGARLITGSEVPFGGLTNPTVPAEYRSVQRQKITIGSHALLFTNTIVLPGVEIGEGAVVSAGSIVHHDLKPWIIYAGNPLVPVSARDRKPILEKAAAALHTLASEP